MTDKTALLVTIGGGVVLSAIYLLYAWFGKKTNPDLVGVAMIFGSTAGFISGGKLCYLLLTDDAKFLVGQEDKVAIFLGGLAVCWVSVLGVKEGFGRGAGGTKKPGGD